MGYRVRVNNRGKQALRAGTLGADIMHLAGIDTIHPSKSLAGYQCRLLGLTEGMVSIEHVPDGHQLHLVGDELNRPSEGTIVRRAGTDGRAAQRAPGRVRPVESVPPPSNTGGKVPRGLKWGRHAVCVDYLRFSGHSSRAELAVDYLAERFGEGEPCKARYFRHTARRFGPASVHWCDTITVVDIPASALREMEIVDPAATREVIQAFYGMGFKATRVDVAVDLYGYKVGLIRRMAEACETGSLCRAKRWGVIQEHARSDIKGDTLYIGARGKKGSGRLVRAYDKGLEQQDRTQGEWERFETEFSGDHAAMVLHHLAEATDLDEMHQECVRLAFGSVEFREPSTSTNRNLERREVLHWWADLINRITTGIRRVSVERTRSNMHSYVNHTNTAFLANFKALAVHTGTTLEELAELLAGHVEPKLSETGAGILIELDNYIRELRGEPLCRAS